MKDKIRKDILKMVGDFYNADKTAKFVPGESRISYSGRVYDEKEIKNLVDASLDFWLTAGRYTKEFEKRLAEFIGVKHCLLVNSGSSANLLAVTALTTPLLKDRQVRPGDEVITTACGFPTTINPIIQNNLVPVFLDVEPGTYNICAEDIEKAITGKTKAIFTAHTLGNPINISKIRSIAKKHNLWWIEDNCDSLGSLYEGKYTGSFGDISTSSFYPPHHITMGEGGAVLTDNAVLRKALLSFRDWGRDCWCDTGCDDTCGKRFSQQFGELPFGYDHKYVYSHIGYNLKATDMQAAIGCAQMEKLPSFIKVRRANFDFLYKVFKQYEVYLILPEAEEDSQPSWFGFPVMVKENTSFKRADIVEYLENNKIATRMLFGGNLTKHPAYKDTRFKVAGELTNTDMVMNNLFWIGVYPGLTDEMLDYIADTVNAFFKGLK